ncbi:hypothetical protein [Leisingera sp. NJS204]|uniref:hypothetical protein n=1 Tax=Leisingera sp. NJS204 TaxID=2508307 RepID=UPI00197D840A|nr:hypothetical protein [Leisingera sp. NJS204]
MSKPMNPIPVSSAERIAKAYGYDQVVIIARRVGDDPNGEHVTTYGRDKAHCSSAARIGEFLKFKVMGWVNDAKKMPRVWMIFRHDLADFEQENIPRLLCTDFGGAAEHAEITATEQEVKVIIVPAEFLPPEEWAEVGAVHAAMAASVKGTCNG